MGGQNNVYKQMVNISQDYLGPSTERFIDRQVRNHLKKDPQKLTKKDVSKLIEWIRGAVSLLTDDKEAIEEYIRLLQHLAHEPEKP